MEWVGSIQLDAAPPEYVILRKLEFFREGGAGKHLSDITAILRSTRIDERALGSWIERLGLGELWDRVRSAS